MNCEMCGYEFDEKTVCAACGSSCNECRCPACGYSNITQSKLILFNKKLRER